MFQESEIAKLAKDIGFAVFRVARLIKHKKIRAEIENSAVDFVKDISIKRVNELGRLVQLSEMVGEMNSTNSYVIRRELSNLRDLINSEIAELPNMNEGIRIGDIFEKTAHENESFDNDISDNNISARSGFKDRQLEVLQFIRQFPGDCRMRDLLSEFPDVSERTLRNDIQKLISRGFIERAGGRSGPVSYFRTIKSSGELRKSENLPETIFLHGSNRETNKENE